LNLQHPTLWREGDHSFTKTKLKGGTIIPTD